MPVRVIGAIGVTPPAHSSTLLVIEGAISPSFIVDFAKAHEAAGFDMALVTGGRIALHVITGKTDAEQEGDGDFAPRAERYQRVQEYWDRQEREDVRAPADNAGRRQLALAQEKDVHCE